MKNNTQKIFWIDLFCGAGGTTTGVHLADANSEVLACVNHDPHAIKSHKANHPFCRHFTEDVRDMKVILKLKGLVSRIRYENPDAIINLWASLECTNYSKAKGGLPRDADSRTLAYSLYDYIQQLDPDYLFIENVREFMAWGPLDENGKPISRKNGVDYMRWCNKIQGFGYSYDFRLLNSADFGAFTSRERYFGSFAKSGMPIHWPNPTHSKNPDTNSMFENDLKPWEPVKKVLDLEDEGNSIFDRKKALSENTDKRILAGLIKFVANGESEYIKRYNGGDPSNKVKSLNEPLGTISTNGRHAVVKAGFIKKYYSGRPAGKVTSLNAPLGTIPTIGNQAVVSTDFLSTYYGNGSNHSVDNPAPTITTKDRISKIDVKYLVDYQYKSNAHSLDKPSPTLLTKDKFAPVTVNFIDQQYGQSKPSSIEKPVGTLTANPKFNFLTSHQFSNKGNSIEGPAPVIIARQDKKPLYLITCEFCPVMIPVYEDDNPTRIKIKEFMVAYGISDIKMRMLRVDELLKIQGFPENYKLIGTKTNQKKFIGNSVVPLMAQKLVEANYQAVTEHFNKAA